MFKHRLDSMYFKRLIVGVLLIIFYLLEHPLSLEHQRLVLSTAFLLLFGEGYFTALVVAHYRVGVTRRLIVCGKFVYQTPVVSGLVPIVPTALMRVTAVRAVA